MARNSVRFEGNQEGMRNLLKSEEAKKVVLAMAIELAQKIDRKQGQDPSPRGEYDVEVDLVDGRTRALAKVDWTDPSGRYSAVKRGWVSDALREMKS